MITILSILLSILLSSAAQAGVLSPVFKLAERGGAKAVAKGALHEADDVAKFVLHEADDGAKLAARESDDLAKAGARGGAKAGTGALARTGGMVERSIAVERAAARAAAPAVHEIHRTVIVPPKTVLAGGAAVAGTVAAHNLTTGERKKDEAIADTLREHPEYLPKVVDGQGGVLHGLGEGIRRGLVLLAGLAGGLFGLAVLVRAIPARRPRPATIDVTADSTVR